MRIDQSYATQASVKPRAPNNPDAALDVRKADRSARSGVGPLARIKSQVDMKNISPREVDQLVDRLEAAGQPMNSDMLILMTYGEKFQEGLNEHLGGSSDPHRRLNLVDLASSYIKLTRVTGGNTRTMDSFMKFLSGFGPGRISTYA